MLFKDTIKLAEYADVLSSVNFISLKATIRNVEEQRLIPIIGNTLYTSLASTYEAAADESAAQSALSVSQKKLLDRCRMLIGPYIAYHYAPKTEVKLSDAGLRREETNSSKTAFQYQGKNFRDACLAEAEAQSELLLQFLEDNQVDYAEWLTDPAFTEFRSLFIKTGKEFGSMYPSHSPYKNYWAMRSKMADVELLHISKAIGEELFNDLKTKSKAAAPGYTDKEKSLLLYIKKAIANFTIAFSIPFLNVRIEANGLSVVAAGARASHDEVSSRSAPTANDISHVIRSAAAAGKEWLEGAIEFLDKNHSDFPKYDYTDPETVTEGCANYGGSFGLI